MHKKYPTYKLCRWKSMIRPFLFNLNHPLLDVTQNLHFNWLWSQYLQGNKTIERSNIAAS